MAAVLDTDRVMLHLSIDPEEAAELPLLYGLLLAARAAVENFCDRGIFLSQEDLDAAVIAGTARRRPIVADAALAQAMLLLIGHWYRNREAVATGPATKMPLSVEFLIYPYRLLGAAS